MRAVWPGEGEQAGLRFDEDLANDEAFEFGAHGLGVLGRGDPADGGQMAVVGGSASIRVAITGNGPTGAATPIGVRRHGYRSIRF